MTSSGGTNVSGQAWRPLHIAMVGQKGLPATYGGIEHVVSETGRRLVERGHRVTVYSRRSYAPDAEPTHLGMDVVPAPTVSSKHLDAIVHSATSTLKAVRSSCDVVHYHALGPGLLAPLPRYLTRSKVVLTVHGLDYERGKWGAGASSVLRAAHWMSGHVPDRTVVVSETLRQHYLDRFGRDVHYVPNGVTAPEPQPAGLVEGLGLRPGGYLLFVGRLVPEKAPDRLIEAFRRVPGDTQLAIVGDSSWTGEFTEQIRAAAALDPRVVLTGFQFGASLAALYEHAAGFVQPSFVEGLPLTLLEAISHGLPVLVSDIGPHLEVLGATRDAARTTFPVGDTDALAAGLTTLVSNAGLTTEPAARLRDEVLRRYDWDLATDALENLYLSVVSPAASGRTRASRPAPAAASEALR